MIIPTDPRNYVSETLTVLFILALTAWGMYAWTTRVVDVANQVTMPISQYHEQEIQQDGPGH